MFRRLFNQLMGNQRVLWERTNAGDAVGLLEKAKAERGVTTARVTHYDPTYITRTTRVLGIDDCLSIVREDLALPITHEAYRGKDGRTRHYLDMGHYHRTLQFSTA